MLAAADAYIVSEEKQEQHHSDLNDAHASLRSNNGLHPGRDLRRIRGNRDHSGHEQHDQARPLEKHRTQIAKRMEEAKNIDKNFVDHGEAERDAQGIASPIEVEAGRIAMPMRGKYDGEGDELREDVSEEKLKLAVQSTTEHHGSNTHLEDGMRHPESVIENFDFLEIGRAHV